MTPAVPLVLLAGGLRSKGFCALVASQCMGAFNDNLLKMVISLMVVDGALADGAAVSYLSLTTIVFVVPYLLFAGYAGWIADRFRKRTVLIGAKVLEFLVMCLAMLALVRNDTLLCLVALFLIALQATVYSPAKYGILPETLPSAKLGRANGVIEATRYLAIVLGSVTGGGILMIWRDQTEIIGFVLLAVAFTGLLATMIVDHPEKNSERRPFRLNPWSEVVDGFRQMSQHGQLALAVIGLAALDLLCTVVMLNAIIAGKTLVLANDLQIGLLGMIAGLGAVVGSALAGLLSADGSRPHLALAGGLGLGMGLIGLSIFVQSYACMAALFSIVGVAGGFVMVPLNALLQQTAKAAKRGCIIAAGNLLSMSSVLVGSGALWLLIEVLGLSSKDIFVFGAAVALFLSLAGLRSLGMVRPCKLGAVARNTDV